MPWDVIFYGSMAIIFIGIMAASARARRNEQDHKSANPAPAPSRDDGKAGT